MKPRREFPLYLVTGIVLGILAGLLISWVLFPVQYVNTAPVTLRSDYKDEYRVLIAAAYQSTGDLERARARLNVLGDPDPSAALLEQSQRASGSLAPLLREFYTALSANPQPNPSVTPVPPTPTLASESPTPPPRPSPTASATPSLTPTAISATAGASATPGSSPTFAVTAAPSSTAAVRFIDTPIPRPTRAPTATPGAPVVLTSADVICEPGKTAGLLQIFVRDAVNAPAPGIELIITWNNGEERFFTGLKPELGNGYADFRMSPGVIYTLRFANSGAAISDLYTPACKAADNSEYFGGLRLNFKQP